MKIIAKTESNYMVEVTEHEIALILGFRTNAETGFSRDMLRIGTQLEITKIDKVSRFVRNLDETKLEMIKKQLQSAIDGIDDAAETTQALTLFKTLEE